MEDELEGRDDNKRRSRNLSEKKRRDQFNVLVNELNTMVCTNNRKMDKSTVLESTIAFLKNHNEVAIRARAHDIREDWKPSFLSNEEFTYLVLEALEGFVIVFSVTGRIHYVSDGITSLLGYLPGDVVNKTLFDLAFEHDRPHLYGLLQNTCTSITTPNTLVLKENEVRFQCYLKRGNMAEEPSYELVQFSGYIRNSSDQTNADGTLAYSQDDGNRLFVCSGRVQMPRLIRDVTLVDNQRNEFTSRHSLEWKFLFLDHRAPPIIGYLPFEVLGTSGYDYYHFDDLEKVVACHQALMKTGVMTSGYYRFLTKGQQWIWLQTRFYITYHQWNSKPEFVVCTHRVVSYADVCKNGESTCDPEAVLEPEQEPTVSHPDIQSAEEPGPSNTQSVTCLSEPSDTFCNTSYKAVSEPSSVQSISGASTSGTTVTGVSTTQPWSVTCGQSYYPVPSDAVSTASHSRDDRPDHNKSNCCNEHSQSSSEHEQRKHEQLQQMIVQQQEELRQVKEQLLLARLGILPPLINVQNQYLPGTTDGESHQNLPRPAAPHQYLQN